jgi:hypothetical protein
MKYAAHPTLYNGIMMRSRLEARWACYFHKRGWSWVYEPYDLHGYTPDFSVDIYPRGSVLVEVKPATKLGQLASPIGRILRAGWKNAWMVVGADPDICMEGVGRHQHQRRSLGTEAPIAWSQACNETQWKPQVAPLCDICGKPALFLHKYVCEGFIP